MARSNFNHINGWHGYRFFLRTPIVLLDKHTRWRKAAKLLNLSRSALQRLEWIIFYETKAQKNASLTCRHFNIPRKTLYKWLNRFDDANLRTLEDQDKTPRRTRQKEITSLEEDRVIKFRKEHIRYGKNKIAKLYQDEYGETISTWKIQYTIKKYRLYFNSKKTEKITKKRARAQKKKRITELSKKPQPGYLIQLDVIVIYWQNVKRYIFTAVDVFSKIAYARMYTTKSSLNAADFLKRLYFLLDEKVVNTQTDNGSEFAKYFEQACEMLKIDHYYSRLRTPTDNSCDERFNRTLKEEFIQLGNFHPNPVVFNQSLTEWLVEYNFKRPHQTLAYETPIGNYQKLYKVSPMYPSRTKY